MAEIVVYDGEASLIIEGTEAELIIPESGESGLYTAIRDAYPVYEGATEITPTENEQVLDTSMKTVTTDITVGAIPVNYGRLLWSGTTLTVF